jgi:hypothetical protein
MLAEKAETASGARLAIGEEAQAPAGLMVFIGKTRAAEAHKPADYTVAVYYWPNIHRDAYHQSKKGKGWTEWEIVKNGKPYFSIYELRTLIQGLGGLEQTRAAMNGFRVRAKAAGFPDVHVNIVDWALPQILAQNKGQPMPGDPSQTIASEKDVLARVNLVERNFQYCQDIANVYHLYCAYQVSPTWESFTPLAAALKQRDARVREFIAHDRSCYDGFPPMFHDLERAITDGRGGSIRMLSGPFKWDVDSIVRKKVLPDTGHRAPPFNQD